MCSRVTDTDDDDADEDGDLVAFSSDDELMMGLACMKDATFRLFIRGEPVEPLCASTVRFVNKAGFNAYREEGAPPGLPPPRLPSLCLWAPSSSGWRSSCPASSRGSTPRRSP